MSSTQITGIESSPSVGRIAGGPPLAVRDRSSSKAFLARAAPVLCGLFALASLRGPTLSQAHIVSSGSVVSNSSWHEERFVDIAAGALHTVGLRSDGSIVAWGDNRGNEPANGQCSDVPALPAGVSYVEVAAGGRHSVALRSDGSFVCWGSNFSYQAPPLVAPPPGLSFVEIAAGGSTTLARRSDGIVFGWGRGRVVPALPPGLTYVEIAAGGDHALGRRSDGAVVAWGNNIFGQVDVPALPAGLSYVEITAGANHTVARRSDGAVVAWGDNSLGQCAVPALPAGLSYVEISAGGEIYGVSAGYTVARRSDGSVVAWGDNGRGQCNVLALPAGLSYVEIAAGGAHAAARRSDGSVVVWGDDSRGQRNAPAPPAGLSYVEIAPSYSHTLARLSDGSVVAWGDNRYGQSDVPALPWGRAYVEIAASAHSVARRSDGSVVAWGYNGAGQCNVPLLPAGLAYVEIAVGASHTLARRSDGSLVAWGANNRGQCDVPVLPPGVSYTQIDAARDRSAACRSDGSLATWGFDQYGYDDAPALPAGISYVEVVTSGYHTLARRSDGWVVAWGMNFGGECNVPPLPPGLSYVEVSSATSTGTIPPTFSISALRRSDGSVVSFGAGVSYPYVQRLPALPAGFSYVEVATAVGVTLARFELDRSPLTRDLTQIAPSPAPDLDGVTPALVEALVPGTAQTVALSGIGLASTTSVSLDGVKIDPSRYTIVSSALILLDMPQASSLGAHELSVSNGEASDSFGVTVVAPATPKYELGTGEPGNMVEWRDGLAYILAGPVGSVQAVFASQSNLPSTNSHVSLGLGNQFTSLSYVGRFVIPAAGWLQVNVPAAALRNPGLAGRVVYSQAIEIAFPTPFDVSNLQSIRLVERGGSVAQSR